MKNNPLVSVIIPNYCHAQYLDQRIQSVLNQTYQNFEVIILDDCSPDDGASKAVIEKYRDNTHVSQIVYNEVNSGSTFKQWQKGFKMAKGELIWIAESDDYCELTLLEELIKVYNSYPNIVLAYSTIVHVNEQGTYHGDYPKGPNKYLSGTDYIRKYLSVENLMRNASSGIFRKDAALSISNEYINYKAAGDYLFWIKIAECGNVAVVNKRLSYFRRHEGVVTSAKEKDGTSFTELRYIQDYLHKNGYTSWLSSFIARVHYNIIASNTSFISKDVKNRVFRQWHFKNKMNVIERFMYGRYYEYVYNKEVLV